MKQIVWVLALAFLTLSQLAFSQEVNEATEPPVKGAGVIDLLKGGTLEAWKVPSAR